MASIERAVANFVDRLEPRSLDGIRGQDELVTTLRELVRTSQVREHPLPPLLLIGSDDSQTQGIAAAVAREFLGDREDSIVEVEADTIDSRSELARQLLSLKANDVLIVHDVDTLDPTLYRQLLTATREFCLEVSNIEEELGAMTPVSLPFFSLIATTAEEISVDVIQDWLTARVQPYEAEALVEVAKWSGLRLGVTITDEAAEELALRCEGRPRELNALVASIYLEYAEELGRDEKWLIDAEMVRRRLE